MLLCSLHVKSTKACFVPCTTIPAAITRPCFHIYVVVFLSCFLALYSLDRLRHMSAISMFFVVFFLFVILTCAKSAPTVASGGVTGASGVNNMVLIGIRLFGITLHSVVIPQRSQ
jgi:hypothetical protein